jgi:hypothetical protein
LEVDVMVGQTKNGKNHNIEKCFLQNHFSVLSRAAEAIPQFVYFTDALIRSGPVVSWRCSNLWVSSFLKSNTFFLNVFPKKDTLLFS